MLATKTSWDFLSIDKSLSLYFVCAPANWKLATSRCFSKTPPSSNYLCHSSPFLYVPLSRSCKEWWPKSPLSFNGTYRFGVIFSSSVPPAILSYLILNIYATLILTDTTTHLTCTGCLVGAHCTSSTHYLQNILRNFLAVQFLSSHLIRAWIVSIPVPIYFGITCTNWLLQYRFGHFFVYKNISKHGY